MIKNFLLLSLLYIVSGSCIDRLSFDIPKTSDYGITVDGHISNQPGPYQIRVNNVFDIESKVVTKQPISVKELILFCNDGNKEILTEVSNGVYETSAEGMQGEVGRIYSIKIELKDGRVYESTPDTLLAGGLVDSVYYSYSSIPSEEGSADNGFDVFLDASKGEGGVSSMWRMTGTFKADTHPECFPGGCFLIDRVCNYKLPCSGVRNIGTAANPEFEQKFPCSCCTCWYKVYDKLPIISDVLFSDTEKYQGIKVYRVPIDPWIFAYKFHIEVSQYSLSSHVFAFWKAIRDQKSALGNLFQPISGRIPVNFVQTAGANYPIQGIFFATSISSKTKYISRNEVPGHLQLPTLDDLYKQGVACVSCVDLFPNSTTTQPSYWIE